MSINIHDLEKTVKGPVWVRNKTRGQNKSRILISVPRENGMGADMVEIPFTYIPVNVALQISRRNLVKCNDFRKSIVTGILELVDQKEVDQIMADPDAQEEEKRVEGLLRHFDPAIIEDPLDSLPKDATVEEDELSRSVLNLGMQVDSVSTSEAVNTVRRIGEFSDAEYSYLRTKFEGNERVAKALTIAMGKQSHD